MRWDAVEAGPAITASPRSTPAYLRMRQSAGQDDRAGGGRRELLTLVFYGL